MFSIIPTEYSPIETPIKDTDHIAQHQSAFKWDRSEISSKTNISGTVLKELKEIFTALDKLLSSSNPKFELHYSNYGNGYNKKDLSKDKKLVKVFRDYIKSFDLKRCWYDVKISSENYYVFELKWFNEPAYRFVIDYYLNPKVTSELRVYMPISTLEFFVFEFEFSKHKSLQITKSITPFIQKLVEKKKKTIKKYTGEADEIFYRMIYGIIGIKKDKYTIQEKQEIDNLLSKENRNMNLYNKFSKVLKLVSYYDSVEIKRKIDKFFDVLY